MNQQQQSKGEQRPLSPLNPELFAEISHYTSSSGTIGMSNELPSPSDRSAAASGEEGMLQNNETVDLSRQLSDRLLSSALEMRGSKRRCSENQGNAQMGVKRSAAARFPGLSLGCSGLSFPPVGLNTASVLGNLGHMSHPLLMAGSGGPSFLQTPGQTLADLQSIFPCAGSDLLRHSVTGNGHIPTPSSSSLPTVFSSASTTIPLSSSPTAAPSSSLASGSLPPYLLNHSMTGLFSSGYPLNYSQPLLPESRMYPSPLLSGSGGFPVPNSSSSTSSFLSHSNNPTSSLLGAALTQPERQQDMENGGSSSDDDVIEVTGQ